MPPARPCELTFEQTPLGFLVVRGSCKETITFPANKVLELTDFPAGACEHFKYQLMLYFGKGGKRYVHSLDDKDKKRPPGFMPYALGRKPDSDVEGDE